MGDIISIARANFLFKIITKVLAERLGKIALKIICTNQRGFILGRHIKECVILALEVVNVLDNTNWGGNVILKIDIKHAFDTLYWNFEIEIVDIFGFNDKFQCRIREILRSIRLSILINENPRQFFECKRGVIQGDPFPPFLFCIVLDFLSGSLMIAAQKGKIKPLRVTRRMDIPIHVLYADGIILFS